MFPERYQFAVFAGPHCGAAERFQAFLAANHTAIAALGRDLAFAGHPGAAAGNLAGAWPGPGEEDEAIEARARILGERLAALAGGCEGMILADHDIVGPGASLLGGRFFPAAGKRARALGAALGRPVERLVLRVRPYGELFEAAWRRYALQRRMEPLAEYVPAMAAFRGGWVELAEALIEALRPARLVVLARAPEPLELFGHLAPGLRLADPVIPPLPPRVTASAIATIQRHYRQGGQFAPGQRERILAFHARQPQLAAEPAFAGLPLADLTGRYVADLDTLSRMAGVELIGGPLEARVPLAAE